MIFSRVKIILCIFKVILTIEFIEKQKYNKNDNVYLCPLKLITKMYDFIILRKNMYDFVWKFIFCYAKIKLHIYKGGFI